MSVRRDDRRRPQPLRPVLALGTRSRYRPRPGHDRVWWGQVGPATSWDARRRPAGEGRELRVEHLTGPVARVLDLAGHTNIRADTAPPDVDEGMNIDEFVAGVLALLAVAVVTLVLAR
jgi:hypothetical protein